MSLIVTLINELSKRTIILSVAKTLARGSTNIPLSVLTPHINRLVPERDFPIHLLDWQDAPSEEAARQLSELGFTKVTRCRTSQSDAFGHGFFKNELTSRALEDQGLCAIDTDYKVLSTAQLLKLPDATDTVIDLRASDAYMRVHIKGSHWRNISELLGCDVPAFDSNVVIGNDVEHASQSADLLAEQGWQFAGIYGWNTGDIDQGLLHSTTIKIPIEKSALFGGRHHGNMQDSRDYLAWEEELPDQIDPVIHQLWLQHLGETDVWH